MKEQININPETSRERLSQALEQQRLDDAQAEAEADAAMQLYKTEQAVNRAETSLLIAELYQRGVKIEDIFGRYYEFEAASDGRSMDIEDAVLAGLYKEGE